MDIISLQKANKAKKKLDALRKRLGEKPEGSFDSVHARLTHLEETDPEVSGHNKISEAERHTAINLNKTNIRMTALLTKGRLEHKDLIVDDFEDDSGIDYDKSSNIQHETNTVSVSPGEEEGELFLVKEETKTIPFELFLSESGSFTGKGYRSFSLEEGSHDQAEVTEEGLRIKQNKYGAYLSPGVFESDIIDMGDNADKIHAIDWVIQDDEVGEIKTYLAASDDGISFSEFQEVNLDHTVSDTYSRYLKVRVVLTGDLGDIEKPGFSLRDESNFKDGHQVSFSEEKTKLNQNYQKFTIVDGQWKSDGHLYKIPIRSGEYKRIEHVYQTGEEVKGIKAIDFSNDDWIDWDQSENIVYQNGIIYVPESEEAEGFSAMSQKEGVLVTTHTPAEKEPKGFFLRTAGKENEPRRQILLDKRSYNENLITKENVSWTEEGIMLNESGQGYEASGFYETEILDINEHVDELQIQSSSPGRSRITIHYALGNTSSDFQEGVIQWTSLPGTRKINASGYSKLKVRFTLYGNREESSAYSLENEDGSSYENSHLFMFDSGIKMTGIYEDEMVKEDSWQQEGYLFRVPVQINELRDFNTMSFYY